MDTGARFDIARLRRIGFEQWDPIGGSVPEDEYDSYLLKAAGNLWNGDPIDQVASYFVRVEVDAMGLEAVPGVYERALKASEAISQYVASLKV
ncbi:hypothetical protein [Phenylobacterium sp.]|jgi:hypothetical protein|uniref:hypothetical protein n=1 Tax=Phenylobacterium sp. TaxID=1871053 RepID=UPI002F92AC26